VVRQVPRVIQVFEEGQKTKGPGFGDTLALAAQAVHKAPLPGAQVLVTKLGTKQLGQSTSSWQDVHPDGATQVFVTEHRTSGGVARAQLAAVG